MCWVQVNWGTFSSGSEAQRSYHRSYQCKLKPLFSLCFGFNLCSGLQQIHSPYFCCFTEFAQQVWLSSSKGHLEFHKLLPLKFNKVCCCLEYYPPPPPTIYEMWIIDIMLSWWKSFLSEEWSATKNINNGSVTVPVNMAERQHVFPSLKWNIITIYLNYFTWQLWHAQYFPRVGQ